MNNATEADDAPRNPLPPPKHQRREALIDTLLRSLDALVFVQIAALYYCDASTAFLFLRAVSQIFFVSPKLIHVDLRAQPRVPPVLIANIFITATHLIFNPPEANDSASQGYIHGGLIVNFVGELGPISKLRLFTLDFLIISLQLLMLAIGHEREIVGGVETTSINEQDLEAEEAGMRRSLENEDGIELENMARDQESDPAVHPLDHYYADPIVLKLDLMKSLRGLVAKSNTGTSNSVDPSVISLLTHGVNRHQGT